jgi:hypothetical protein
VCWVGSAELSWSGWIESAGWLVGWLAHPTPWPALNPQTCPSNHRPQVTHPSRPLHPTFYHPSSHQAARHYEAQAAAARKGVTAAAAERTRVCARARSPQHASWSDSLHHAQREHRATNAATTLQNPRSNRPPTGLQLVGPPCLCGRARCRRLGWFSTPGAAGAFGAVRQVRCATWRLGRSNWAGPGAGVGWA